DGVGELDVDAEVVRVQLELVALAERMLGLDVHVQACDRAVKAQPPVLVVVGVGLELHGSRGSRRGVLPGTVARVSPLHRSAPARETGNRKPETGNREPGTGEPGNRK